MKQLRHCLEETVGLSDADGDTVAWDNEVAAIVGYQPFARLADLMDAAAGLNADGNPVVPRSVPDHQAVHPGDSNMSFLKRLFSSNTADSPQRVRVCVECGMPVAEHKEWCSILRGRAEMERRNAERQ